jgi:membrane associated rhomboid family serine protease
MQATLHWGGIFVAVLLSLLHQMSASRPALREAWVMDSAAVRAGQWWRLFTAELLHADLAHLMANATSGILLFGLAMARFGPGLALLACFLAGAAGNIAGLALYTREYTGLGASGAVMGALGLLTFHTVAHWRKNPLAARDLIRGALAGVFLFLVLGVNPNSDVVAHLGGFVTGGMLGALLSFLPTAALEKNSLQSTSGFAFTALLVLTCWLGLAR